MSKLKAMDLPGIQEEMRRLRRENQILRDSVGMARTAVDDWKGTPPEERFELAAMLVGLSRVEAALDYVGLLEHGFAVDHRTKKSPGC